MAIPTGITLTPNSGVAPFSVQITGTNLFERPSYRCKETFTVATPNTLPVGWRGTDPTRVDGVIGKGVLCSTTGSRYIAAYATGQVFNGANDMWFRSDNLGVNSLFVSMWIKPTTVTDAGLFCTTKGNNVYSEGYPNSTITAQANFSLQSNGRLTFALNEGSTGAVKCVYTATGVITANTWYHILGQWTSVAPGVSVDPPVIWINGVKVATTVATNGNFSALTPYLTAGLCTSIGKAAYPSNTPPSMVTWGVGYFNGVICDVYTGNAFLTDDQVLMYANLPKVELLKV